MPHEKNNDAFIDRLKRDRERQEQLARERLANRKGRKGTVEEEDAENEPEKGLYEIINSVY